VVGSGRYRYQRYPYRTPRELSESAGARHPVIIVGAGPVGLAAAIDLARHGIASVVVDDNDTVSVGSRAICWAKRTLEIFDRLGVAERMIAKGVTWKVGRVYHRDRELYHFDLLPEGGHKMPAFINLQQYYVEQYLVERAAEFPHLIDLRWRNRACRIENCANGVTLGIETPDGGYRLEADWLLAADGARSTIRTLLGHPFEGATFEEKFLIVDVRLDADYPSERRFWFQPQFDPSQSVLIHRQPDDVFRIDFQLGWDADAEAERRPERALERVRRVVGPGVRCEFEWCSVYTFRCARMPRFVDRRVIFAGDAAHVVSPFGARGGNGGVQDIDNLCWKLASVLRKEAPVALLETYDGERGHGADENILNSRRTTAFMSPRTPAEQEIRDGVLALAAAFPFARGLVNPGRLSKPCSLAGRPGFAADDVSVAGTMAPGTACTDAPVATAAGAADWLLNHLGGRPTVMVFVDELAEAAQIEVGARECGIGGLDVLVIAPGARGGPACALGDSDGLVRARYGGARGVTYLIRPDQHVLARWRQWRPRAVRAAWETCLGSRLS
jgi:3-(3-hydroxy-phenyl)propionate hydroxylase